jgi:5-methyltetrahydrofolate--homocysteine methyltransferase
VSDFYHLLRQSQERVILLDGAMGTQLHLRDRAKRTCLERLNLDSPEVVAAVHREYIEAGAEIIQTNTFQGSSIKLDEYGLGSKTYEINLAASEIARNAAGQSALVAGSIGPTGKFVRPLGSVGFDEMVEAFAAQAKGFSDGGADLIIIETMFDTREARAAVVAARVNSDLPVVCTFTFSEEGDTPTGASVESVCVLLESLRVDVLGANCTTGPAALLPVMERFAGRSSSPLIVQPNAGLPRLEDGETIFDATPEHMADYAGRFARAGVSFIGGCCGSTPAHIAAMKQAVDGVTPKKRKVEETMRLSSRSSVVTIPLSGKITPVGERINPTGKKKLSAEMRKGVTHTLRDMAVLQVNAGAEIIDINVGASGVDESNMMEYAVYSVNNATNAPVSIDSPRVSTIEAGLKAADGKPLLNSITLGSQTGELLSLARMYGASIILLAVSDEGVMKTCDEKIALLKELVEEAGAYGFHENDILLDPVTMAVATDPRAGNETLEALEIISKEMELRSIVGLSNISHGLPERSVINSTFLSMAVNRGLTAAILDPLDDVVMSIMRTSAVVAGHAGAIDRYLKTRVAIPVEGDRQAFEPGLETDDPIYNAVLMGEKDSIDRLIEEALDSGVDPIEVNQRSLLPALERVGELYEAKKYFLPQMMLSAETMQRAFAIIEESLKESGERKLGPVILATVKGDIHDIGKNIVAAVLRNSGFDVIDLGKSVPPVEIAKAARESGAELVGLSSLMTTTMDAMKDTVDLLGKEGVGVRVMVGGAVVTRKYADSIGADGYARDAFSAVEIARQLLEDRAT